MNLVNILNSNKFDEHSRSEVMLILADQLEDCGDVLTAEALRWAKERNRWPRILNKNNRVPWWTYDNHLEIVSYYQLLSSKFRSIDPESPDIFSAFRQLGIWLDEGFVIRDFDGYPKKEVVA